MAVLDSPVSLLSILTIAGLTLRRLRLGGSNPVSRRISHITTCSIFSALINSIVHYRDWFPAAAGRSIGIA